MSSIDDRVTSLRFDNSQFEAAAKVTLATLDQLNKSLKLEGAAKGFADINASSRGVNLGHISQSLQNIEDHFKAMSVVAISALASVATKAVDTGLQLVRSLTVDPFKQGFQEYELNLNSIQTILANTQAAGTNLSQVTKALDELNHYADLTIYSFSEMAKNIGTFSAAGVALGPAVSAIKGIANLAALSGSNSMQAATAMYQLSQAISTGTVKLIDWNSVVNAGMGGTVFQRALAQTAVAMGKLNGTAVTLSGTMKTVKINGDSFRDSLQKGWLTADVLTNTLAQFTGDLTDAELAAIGFNKTQIAEIQKQANAARAAATEVKTISQLIGALKESVGSGWAETWKLVFGNFEEAKKLWSGVYKTIDGIVGASSDARNELLKGWGELGGRDVLIKGIGNAFSILAKYITPIKEAFNDIFPPATAKSLYDLTVRFSNFIETLKPSPKVIETIREVSYAVFAVLRLVFEIIGNVTRVLGHLIGVASDGSDGFLDFVISVASFVQSLVFAIENGDKLSNTFDNIGRVLQVPIEMIKIVGKVLGDLFKGIDTDKAANSIVNFADSVNPLGHLADIVVAAWRAVLNTFEKIYDYVGPLAVKASEYFQQLSDSVGGLDFSNITDLINSGALIALVAVLHNSLGRGGISGAINELTEALGAMTMTLRAAALLQLAIAIGVIAAAAVVLANVDADALTRSLTAIAALFTELIVALAAMTKLPSVNVAKMYVMASTLTVLGVAINILALAVKQLATLKPEDLHKGLISVGLLLGAIVAAAKLLPSGAELASTSVGLLIISTAILILSQSVKQLATLSWEELGKGLSAVGTLLASLSLFAKFTEANAAGILSGAGIVLLATGIKILADVIIDLQTVSWENIGKGMAVIAGSLTLITAALTILSDAAPTAPLSAAAILITAVAIKILGDAIASMSGMSWETFGKGMAVIGGSLILITAALAVLSDVAPTAILSAGAILIVAVALQIIAQAISNMGSMTWEEIAKGLVVLAGSLAIITLALIGMSGALPGALALLVVSGALVTLASVLKVLGGMSWGEIVKGLTALAAGFAVIGIAAMLLQPAIPAMIGLGVAIALIGAGLALAGAGVFLLATGLAAISVAGAGASAAIAAILGVIIGVIPALAKQAGVAVLIIIDVLIKAVPKIVELILKLLDQLTVGLIALTPKLGALALVLILVIIAVLEKALPRLYEAGLHVLIGLLTAIRNNIGKVADLAADIIIEFINGVARNGPKIVDAGFKALVKFMDGITKAVDDNAEEIGRAGADLAFALAKGVVKGLGAAGGEIKNKLVGVIKEAWDAALDFLGINSPSKEGIWAGEMTGQGLSIGLDGSAKVVKKSAEGIAATAVKSLRDTLSTIVDQIPDKFDATPRIVPVLDLSVASKQAASMWETLNVKPIEVSTSFNAAKATGNMVADVQNGSQNDQTRTTGDTYNFTQNNTSPKALSTAEIYRQTKNQISTVRGGLPA